MRFNNIIYQKIRFACILLLCILITGTISAQQQQREKKARQMVNVTLKVVDENAVPIPGINVVVGEGITHTQTDANGSVSFKGYPEDVVTITSGEYEKVISNVVDIIQNSTLTLIKSKLFMTSDDIVLLPFNSFKKRNITGSTYVVKSDQLDKYPSNDLRNALTGLGGMEVIEKYGSPGMSAQEYIGSFGATEKINVSARGHTLNFMVDNVYTDITELTLDPNEIESVSIVKDIVGKAMFGPYAADGLVYITTKRGSRNEHSLNVNFEQGVSAIDIFPQWAPGANYASLNNFARKNDGLTENYDMVAIHEYSKNDPWNKYYPSIDFRNMMLKNTRPFTRANVSSSGGNDIVQYFAYVGYNGEGDNYKIGSTADYSRITTRSNLDILITKAIKVGFDFYGNLGIRRSPNYGYDPEFTSENSSSNPVLGILEMPDVLNDITSIPPIAFPVWASYDSISNTPWYGVTTTYANNPIGNLEGNGFYKDQGRQGSANVHLDIDLKGLLPGLTSKTFFGFNTYNLVRVGKAENYVAYQAIPQTAADGTKSIKLTQSHLGVSQADMAKLMDYYFQRYVVYENLGFDRSFGKSHILTSLTYYQAKTFKNDIEEPERMQNEILTGTYTFDDKYSLMGVLNYAGTYSFAKGKRYDLFPSIGAAWIISQENFMSGLKFLNYLKLRAEYGIIGVETFMTPYRYRDNWSTNTTGGSFGAFTANQWFGSGTDANVNRASPSRIGNPDLTWEKSKELSAGLDASLFRNKLYLEATYFNTLREGTIVQLANALPFMLGFSGARPYSNYNNTQYYGVESFLQFTDWAGDFRYSFGGSATVQNSKRIKYDEPAYRNEYQRRTGKPSDAFFGQLTQGVFESDSAALAASQYDASMGDLKYTDMNQDGIIDDNDMTMVGHTSPRLFYSVNASFAYKNLELTLVGTGRAFYDIALTNGFFWNGWGDDNYSQFVMENLGGAYPRLTYNKVNNNFVNSDFWLTKGDYFKIQTAELAYNLPATLYKYIGARGIRIFARGANLFTFTKVKYVDPESKDAGVTNYPLNRTFTGGIKLNF